MSAEVSIPRDRPRSPSARIVWESCRRPDRYITLFSLMAVIFAINVFAVKTSRNPDFALELGCECAAVACAAGWIIQHRRRAKLLNLWRSGELVEVTYRSAWHVNTAAYACTIEYGDRTARVILADYPEPGTKLPALVEGSWIAVQDVIGGRLRLGHLKERS